MPELIPAVPDVLIASTMIALRKLLADQPIAFYELVMLCRDRNHVLFGNSSDKIRSLGLLESNGQPHDAVREITLAAVTGEGFNMVLGDPRA